MTDDKGGGKPMDKPVDKPVDNGGDQKGGFDKK
jgi:hypothetical protein